jgi:putative ABC transport system permease protein
MKGSMLTIAVRGVRNNPFRFVATGLAIVLGIGFFVGTSVLTASVSRTLDSSVTQAFSNVDAAVQSSSYIEAQGFKIRPRISRDLIPKVEAVPQAAEVAPFVTGYAQVVGSDGKVLSGGSPSAFAWISQPRLNPLQLVSGHAPEGDNQLVVDQGSFTDGHFHLGQRVRLLPLGTAQRFTLVGVMKYKSADQEAQRLVALSQAGAARVFATTEVNQIFVAARPGTTNSQLASAVAKVLPKGVQAESGAQFRTDLQNALGGIVSFISTALRVFAAVALIVGAFIIYNTFSITVAQRTREMALLRAIGATRRQVTRSVVTESLVIGVVSSIAGTLFGLLLGWLALLLFASLGVRLGTTIAVPAGGLVAGVLLGTVITLLAAVIPARRAARTPPIAALRAVAADVSGSSRGRAIVGTILVVAGVAIVALSISSAAPKSLLAGGILLLAGVLTLGPVIARPLAMFVGAPMARLRDPVGDLARQNAARNPRRTSTTAAALMIGVTLVAAATVFASTLRSSLKEQTSGQIKTSLVVSVISSAASAGGGLNPSLEGKIAQVPGVNLVSPMRTSIGEQGGSLISVAGVNPATASRAFDPGVSTGSLDSLAQNGTVAVSQGTATANGLHMGSSVRLQLSQRTLDLKVVALFQHNQVMGNWVVGNGVFDSTVSGRPLDSLILVNTAANDTASTEHAISGLLTDNPTATVQTAAAYAKAQGDQVNTLLYVMYGLLGFSVLVALIGIVNTLALSIFERTREIGLLRAVGMTRRQLASTIRYEAAIVGLIGTILGLGLGIIFGWLASVAARKTFPVFVMPWTGLVVIAVVGLLCGILAGVLPARRAAKFNVLAAIASE